MSPSCIVQVSVAAFAVIGSVAKTPINNANMSVIDIMFFWVLFFITCILICYCCFSYQPNLLCRNYINFTHILNIYLLFTIFINKII